jgi:hypothetical protein
MYVKQIMAFFVGIEVLSTAPKMGPSSHKFLKKVKVYLIRSYGWCVLDSCQTSGRTKLRPVVGRQEMGRIVCVRFFGAPSQMNNIGQLWALL